MGNVRIIQNWPSRDKIGVKVVDGTPVTPCDYDHLLLRLTALESVLADLLRADCRHGIISPYLERDMLERIGKDGEA